MLIFRHELIVRLHTYAEFNRYISSLYKTHSDGCTLKKAKSSKCLSNRVNNTCEPNQTENYNLGSLETRKVIRVQFKKQLIERKLEIFRWFLMFK